MRRSTRGLSPRRRGPTTAQANWLRRIAQEGGVMSLADRGDGRQCWSLPNGAEVPDEIARALMLAGWVRPIMAAPYERPSAYRLPAPPWVEP
jgi:hypothetical protein